MKESFNLMCCICSVIPDGAMQDTEQSVSPIKQSLHQLLHLAPNSFSSH